MNPFRCLPLPLVLLLLALLPSREAAYSTPGTRTRKIGGTATSSVFSLFNLKPQSKFWTESVMRTEFDDLEGSASRDSSNKALLNFTRAGGEDTEATAETVEEEKYYREEDCAEDGADEDYYYDEHEE